MKLQNKIALVTGAASGIGKEIARTYAREGAKVAIADLNKDAAEAAAAELRAQGFEAISVAMDVTDEAQVMAGVAEIVKAWGALMCWSATPEFRSFTRSKNFHWPTGKRCWPFTLTALFSPPKPCCRTCTPAAAAAA